MKKIGILSDLHMEFQPWLFEPEADVFYLNAGDTHPQKLMRDYFESLFKNNNYFGVMGNHDYYGNSFVGADADISLIELNGIRIAGAPLWTEISPVRWYDFTQYMMDFQKIKDLTYDRYINVHDKHRKFLFTADADIWVTHHLPSYHSVHEDYRNSDGNDFFATELSEQILNMRKPPKLIVHGHTHKRMDYMIGDTRVICHPRGYPGENEWYKNYAPMIVEIE